MTDENTTPKHLCCPFCGRLVKIFRPHEDSPNEHVVILKPHNKADLMIGCQYGSGAPIPWPFNSFPEEIAP